MTQLTARNLRTALFHLENQNMTVKELRAMLYKIDAQDDDLELDFSMWIQLEAEVEAEAKQEAEFYA